MQASQSWAHRPLRAAVIALAAGSALPAPAQDIRVEVTGTNIRRVEGEGALPVTVLDRETIERTGAQTAAELLQYVSANNSGGAVLVTNVIGTQSNSVSTASLRGLGGQNTLVLINGKRISAASGEINGIYGVNIDSIPFSAIERVEVLKDGASAIYGSDAIGGVINFILRSEFKGVELSGFYGAPTRGGGGGEKGSVSATAGTGDLATDKFNVFLSAYYAKNQSLDQNKRSFSDSSIDVAQGLVGISGNTFPAHITTGDIGTPGFPDCAPGVFDPTLNDIVGERCVYDPARIDGVNAIPEQEFGSILASGRWQITPNWQLYGLAGYNRVDTRYVVQPTPLSDQVTYGPNAEYAAAFLLPPSSPYYPTALAEAAGVAGQPLNLRYRAQALGLRDTTDEVESWLGNVGIKGQAMNWDWDGSFTYSRNDTSSRPRQGFARFSDIVPLLNSGRVNPFGPQTPDVQAELDAMQFRDETFGAKSTGWMFEGKTSGSVYTLPTGDVLAAFGAQAGRQELKQHFHPDLQVGDVTGFGGNNLDIDADRDWWAAYAEFVVPLHKTVELNAAVRYDDYSDFGSTTNPKFSLRWNPMRELLFRGSWGTGFVAPTLTQAYGANTVGLTEAGLEDPLRCPTTRDSSDCITQFNVLFGGNQALKPQTSTQWTAGFVLEPIRNVSLSFDWFNLDVEDLFSNGPTPLTILGDQAQYGDLITRGPVDPAFPGIPGPITLIDQRFINIGRVKIEGFDVDLRATSPATEYGRFSFSLDGTYYRKYDVQQTDGTFQGFVSNALNASVSGITPRYKQYAAVTWQYGPWSTTLGNLYQSSYIDVNTDADDNPRRVGSMSLWDLNAAYTGLKNWRFVLGVQNLFDRDPPFTNQQTTFQVGYDPTYYDARARFVYASVTYRFE